MPKTAALLPHTPGFGCLSSPGAIYVWALQAHYSYQRHPQPARSRWFEGITRKYTYPQCMKTCQVIQSYALRPAGSYLSGCCINFSQHVNVIIKPTLQVRQTWCAVRWYMNHHFSALKEQFIQKSNISKTFRNGYQFSCPFRAYPVGSQQVRTLSAPVLSCPFRADLVGA